MKAKKTIVDKGNSKNYIKDRLLIYAKDRIITPEEMDKYRNGDPQTCEWVDIILEIAKPLFEEFHNEIQQYISISEKMDSDDLSPPDGAKGLSFVEFSIYTKGYQDAYHKYGLIVRKLLAELKSINKSTTPVTSKTKDLRGKSREICDDPKERERFTNYFLNNSIKRTANHFNIAQGTVKNIAEKCGIKKTSH